MKDGGTAIMGTGIAAGEKRAEVAARQALESPLLEGHSITGARNVLVNITAGYSPGIQESMRATEIIQSQAGDDAELIFGVVVNPELGESFQVTVIATGFEYLVENTPLRSTPRTSIGEDDTFYKGQDNLKRLDDPAFVRRGGDGIAPAPEPVEDAPPAVEDTFAPEYPAASVSGDGVAPRDRFPGRYGAAGERQGSRPEAHGAIS